MVDSFARVGVALTMKVGDNFQELLAKVVDVMRA
jgi:hypothetical protein